MASNYGRRTRQNYERKSILDVVQQNFSYFDRNTFVHRLIYVGEIATASSDVDLDYTKIIDGFQRTVKPINDRYCDERVSGFLLCYGRYFCHVLESSEESLMRHLKLLNECEHVCFANLKLIIVFHHMNQRFVDDWVPISIKTPTFLIAQDELTDRKQTADKIKSTIEKLYQIGLSLKPKLEESKVKVRSSARQKQRRKSPTPRHVNINVEYQFLPQYENLQFLVNSPFTSSLKDYLRLYDRLTLDETEDEDFRLRYLHERGLIALDNSNVDNSLIQKSFNWNSDNVKLLISLFDNEKENHRNPKQKKKCVWERIAAEMGQQGHKVSAEECDKKFRNLKVRYKTIKDKIKSTGECRTHWEFFKAMDDVLLDDATINPQIELLASFPLNNDKQGEPTNVEENATLTVAHSDIRNTDDLNKEEVPQAGITKHAKQKKTILKTKNRELQQFRLGLLSIEKEKVQKLDIIANAYSRIATALEERNKLISTLQKTTEKE